MHAGQLLEHGRPRRAARPAPGVGARQSSMEPLRVTRSVVVGVAVALAQGALAQDTVANATNATDAVAEAEALAGCQSRQNEPYVYFGTLPFWTAAGVYWTVKTCRTQRQVATDLHRMLMWVPCIEVLKCLATVAYRWTCPWYTSVEKMVAAGWVIVTIIKEPTILVCLLLVAKGWTITRPRLSSREICVSSLLVALFYGSVILQISIEGYGAYVPMLVLYALMLAAIMAAVVSNLRVLKAQLLALRLYNIDATTTPAFTK